MFNNKCCLFIGNISESCSLADIQKTFAPFGEIIDSSIKVDPKTGRHLSYGFIKYANPKSAHRAMTALNGATIHGRQLRVGKVVNKREDHEDNSDTHGIPSVHVSYISYQIDNLVTEESLISLFSAYGTVLDASIKKSTVDEVTKFQSGFGFIHYSNKKDGIEAAFRAAETLYDERIDNVNYTCKISHALEKYLTSGQLEIHAERESHQEQQMGSPQMVTSNRSFSSQQKEGNRRSTSKPPKIGNSSPVVSHSASMICARRKSSDAYQRENLFSTSISPRMQGLIPEDSIFGSQSFEELPSSEQRYSPKSFQPAFPSMAGQQNAFTQSLIPVSQQSQPYIKLPQHSYTKLSPMDNVHSANYRSTHSSNSVNSMDTWDGAFMGSEIVNSSSTSDQRLQANRTGRAADFTLQQPSFDFERRDTYKSEIYDKWEAVAPDELSRTVSQIFNEAEITQSSTVDFNEVPDMWRDGARSSAHQVIPRPSNSMPTAAITKKKLMNETSSSWSENVFQKSEAVLGYHPGSQKSILSKSFDSTLNNMSDVGSYGYGLQLETNMAIPKTYPYVQGRDGVGSPNQVESKLSSKLSRAISSTAHRDRSTESTVAFGGRSQLQNPLTGDGLLASFREGYYETDREPTKNLPSMSSKISTEPFNREVQATNYQPHHYHHSGSTLGKLPDRTIGNNYDTELFEDFGPYNREPNQNVNILSDVENYSHQEYLGSSPHLSSVQIRNSPVLDTPPPLYTHPNRSLQWQLGPSVGLPVPISSGAHKSSESHSIRENHDAYPNHQRLQNAVQAGYVLNSQFGNTGFHSSRDAHQDLIYERPRFNSALYPTVSSDRQPRMEESGLAQDYDGNVDLPRHIVPREQIEKYQQPPPYSSDQIQKGNRHMRGF